MDQRHGQTADKQSLVSNNTMTRKKNEVSKNDIICANAALSSTFVNDYGEGQTTRYRVACAK